MEARKYFVSGRVQGVGFRFFVERAAAEMALRGYVRNRSDGSVEVYACGDEKALGLFRAKLESGPPASRVEHMEEQKAPTLNYRTFVIEPTV